MNPGTAIPSLDEHISHIPIIDTHEHIPDEEIACANKLGFFGFFEHYVSSDLVSAGMPADHLEALRNQDNGLTVQERWALMSPWWPYVRTTAYGRAMLEYMRDLFQMEDITEETVAELCQRINDARKPGWFKTVLHDRARIDKALVIRWPGQHVGVDRELFRAVPVLDHYAMLVNRTDLTNLEQEAGHRIEKLNHLLQAQEAKLDTFTSKGIVAVKIFLAYSRTLQIDRWDKTEAKRVFNRLLTKKSSPQFAELKPLQDFMTRNLVVLAAERGLPLQVHTGLQEGNGNYIENSRPTLLTSLLLDFPQARFDLFHAGYPWSGELSALAKNLANVYADLCWMSAVSPAFAARTLDEWIETIPANKILAVGGDSNYAEGAYGHCKIARRIAAQVLGRKVESDYFTLAEARWLAERILRKNARELFRLE
jgi:uncharacterized protein